MVDRTEVSGALDRLEDRVGDALLKDSRTVRLMPSDLPVLLQAIQLMRKGIYSIGDVTPAMKSIGAEVIERSRDDLPPGKLAAKIYKAMAAAAPLLRPSTAKPKGGRD